MIVAVPSPIGILPVTADGRKIDAADPADVYPLQRDLRGRPRRHEQRTRSAPATSAEILKAPLKSLAVHMGLAVYGRNNITYVPGFGSGHQLCGYIVRTGRGRSNGARGPEMA